MSDRKQARLAKKIEKTDARIEKLKAKQRAGNSSPRLEKAIMAHQQHYMRLVDRLSEW